MWSGSNGLGNCVLLLFLTMRGYMRIIYTAVLLLISACASIQPNQARIEFDSSPPGATISNGSTSGAAPLRLTWTFNNGHATGLSELVTATWVSGATTSIRMQLSAGRSGTYTLQRPSGAPGLDQDIQWAMHLNRERDQRDEVIAAALIGVAANINAQNAQQQQPSIRNTTCYKSVSGRSMDCTSF